MYASLIGRAQQEVHMLDHGVVEIMKHNGTVEELKNLLKEHLLSMRQFKEANSMGVIADKANQHSNKKVTSKTSRKWYNEYEEFSKFKEDIRGCHERNFFLSEYGYKRRFELYLKHERERIVNDSKTFPSQQGTVYCKRFSDRGDVFPGTVYSRTPFCYLRAHGLF